MDSSFFKILKISIFDQYKKSVRHQISQVCGFVTYDHPLQHLQHDIWWNHDFFFYRSTWTSSIIHDLMGYITTLNLQHKKFPKKKFQKIQKSSKYWLLCVINHSRLLLKVSNMFIKAQMTIHRILLSTCMCSKNHQMSRNNQIIYT